LSGSVFSLCCNPPFLVGAAWLPWALGMMITGSRTDRWRRGKIAGLALAMMVTGGDPQSALHAVLVAIAVAAGREFMTQDVVWHIAGWYPWILMTPIVFRRRTPSTTPER